MLNVVGIELHYSPMDVGGDQPALSRMVNIGLERVVLFLKRISRPRFNRSPCTIENGGTNEKGPRIVSEGSSRSVQASRHTLSF